MENQHDWKVEIELKRLEGMNTLLTYEKAKTIRELLKKFYDLMIGE